MTTTTTYTTPYPSPPSHPFTYTLYTFFGSSCTARVRIVAHLKRIPLTYRFVKLHKGEQHLPSYISGVNPSASVPALVVQRKGDAADANDNSSEERRQEEPPVAIITQSVAIIEFLDEVFPSPDGTPAVRLLPPLSQPFVRARVRELTNVVVCDIQPLTNMRVFKYVGSLMASNTNSNSSSTSISVPTSSPAQAPEQNEEWKEDPWQYHFMTLGLTAYENLLTSPSIPHDCRPGRFSVGDAVSMADVCLVAAVDRGVRYDVDMNLFPTIKRIDAAIRALEAYELGGFRGQPDTFRSLRAENDGKL